MGSRTKMIRKQRKAPKRKKEPGIQERLKKLSDSAPVAQMRGKSITFDNEELKLKKE